MTITPCRHWVYNPYKRQPFEIIHIHVGVGYTILANDNHLISMYKHPCTYPHYRKVCLNCISISMMNMSALICVHMGAVVYSIETCGANPQALPLFKCLNIYLCVRLCVFVYCFPYWVLMQSMCALCVIYFRIC